MAYVPCKYLQIKDRRPVRKGEVYNCRYEVEMPPLPASITSHWQYGALQRVRVEKQDCAKCPCFTPAALGAPAMKGDAT